ncbi:stage V sporulation protein T [Hathewaya histolytica]|uniref:stage V sporulation protein T n=1 Tax=Hathewaya histolytica TaxID=1498 RepID=UPI003B677436
MKATGIVRRIDDLGRVVIPKEIRRTLRIREGDPLEIFTDREGGVILKKYSPIEELSNFSKEYADALQQSLGGTVIITDKDGIISISGGSRKEYMDRKISSDLERIMEERKPIILGEGSEDIIPIYEDDDESKYRYQVIAPIIAEGDTIGNVVMLTDDERKEFGDLELKLAETAANFLGKQME